MLPSLRFVGDPLRIALFLAILSLPTQSQAVGFSDETEPPEPSETTTECAVGTIWDDETEACVAPEDATQDQAGLYRDARELAWAGRLDDATRVLNAMHESDRVLTYKGFVARKSGKWLEAESYYQAALARNPDNLLARAYYGQGLLSIGDRTGAETQLREIRARGGRVSWPELALRLSLEGGHSAY